MTLARTISKYIGPLIPQGALIKVTSKNIISPFYHTVKGDYELPHIKNLYRARSVVEFKKDLEYLLKYYRPMSLEDIASLSEVGGKTNGRPGFFLSFDDGLRELHDLIMPILYKMGVPATVFVNSAFVDNKSLFHRYLASALIEHLKSKKPSTAVRNEILKQLSPEMKGSEPLDKIFLGVAYNEAGQLHRAADILEFDINEFLKTQRPYLSTTQIRVLQEKGFTVGAHSIDHPLYRELNLQEQLRQTRQSCEYVDTSFSGDIRSFSFPFSDVGVGLAFFDSIDTEQDRILLFGGQEFKSDVIPNMNHRHAMEGSDYSGATVIKAAYLRYLLQRVAGRTVADRV